MPAPAARRISTKPGQRTRWLSSAVWNWRRKSQSPVRGVGGNWALGRKAWAEAVQAYRYGFAASERLIAVQLLRGQKEAWLREVQGLPGRGAYVLAKTSDLRGAVVALEAGRARLLAEALEESRRDLERLEEMGHKGAFGAGSRTWRTVCGHCSAHSGRLSRESVVGGPAGLTGGAGGGAGGAGCGD